jgi:hypothetical protein
VPQALAHCNGANSQPQSITVTTGANTTTLLAPLVISASDPEQSWVWKLSPPKPYERIYDTSGRRTSCERGASAGPAPTRVCAVGG